MHLYTYATFVLKRATIEDQNLRKMRAKALSHGHTEGECQMVEADPREFALHGFTRCGQRDWGGPEGMTADERERHHVRCAVLAGAVMYTPDMEYTHYENIDGDAITQAAYHERLSPQPFPTSAPQLAALAKRIIYSGFVQYRGFDSCFEMGNGGEVMTLLVKEARGNDVLRAAIIAAEFHIGKWDEIERSYPANAESAVLFESAGA